VVLKYRFQIVKKTEFKRSFVCVKKWVLHYFVSQINSHIVYLVYNHTIGVCKDCSIKCHYNIHKEIHGFFVGKL